MKKTLMLLAALLLVSCSPIKGLFNANEELTFKGKKYLLSRGKDIVIDAGEYEAKIFKETRKTLVLKLKDKMINGEPAQISFKIPKGTSLPGDHGELKLTAKQAKQNYDVKAVVDTEYTTSESQRGRESCTWNTYRRVCRPHCRYVNGRRICRDECHRETVTHYGTQEVEYHYSYADKEVDIDILNPGTEEVVGNFLGKKHTSKKVYEHQGACY